MARLSDQRALGRLGKTKVVGNVLMRSDIMLACSGLSTSNPLLQGGKNELARLMGFGGRRGCLTSPRWMFGVASLFLAKELSGGDDRKWRPAHV